MKNSNSQLTLFVDEIPKSCWDCLYHKYYKGIHKLECRLTSIYADAIDEDELERMEPILHSKCALRIKDDREE